MSFGKTEKIVHEFLANQSAEVLSIKGNWGVGKTYFWKKILRQSAQDLCREKYCYVSLFGIASLAELKATIFENTVAKSQIGKGLPEDSAKHNFDKTTNRWGWRSIAKLRSLLSSVPTPYGNVEPLVSLLFTFALVKDAVICLDDLERQSDTLSTKDVLGLISSLKEERNCKVVLIFSDANFGKENQQEYEQFREKVVDVEVRFSPTPAESAALVFTTPDIIDTQLSAFTTALSISNIRILQRIKRAASIATPLLQGFDPQITQSALRTLALFGWSYYSHRHDEKVPSYAYVTSRNYFGKSFGDKKTEQQRGWDALLLEYEFLAVDELDMALRSVIENGFLDEDLVRMAAEKLHQQVIATQSINAFGEAWDRFWSFHDDDGEEKVVSTFVDLLKKHAHYISPSQLNSLIELLRELSRGELANELIDFYIAARREDKEIFDYSGNILIFGMEPDAELARKFDLQLDSTKETPTLEDALAHIAQEHGWSVEQEKALASATPDEFYILFKSVTKKTLHSYIKATLQFGQLGNATDRHRAITTKATDALLRIGSESLINKVRVKRYGIPVPDLPNTRLPNSPPRSGGG
jgi:hypothetical protein